MAEFEAEITGLDELLDLLQQAAPAALRNALPEALNSAADVVAQAVKSRAAENGEIELAEGVAIVTTLEPDGLRGTSLIGFEPTTTERTCQPLDDVAVWAEYGHAMVTHAGKRIGHVPAKPFMRPALDSSAHEAVSAFTDSLTSALSSEMETV